MKLVMDEKFKHRLIGLAVIISLGAIFAPAIMRKSSQKLEGNLSTSIQLPPKPVTPDVAATEEKEMFKTIKVARVNIQDVPAEKQLPQLVHAEPISTEVKLIEQTDGSSAIASIPKESIQLVVSDAAKTAIKKETVLAVNKKPKQVAAVKEKVVPKAIHVAKNTRPVQQTHAKKQVIAVKKTVSIVRRPLAKKEVYAVQLASFAKVSNAQALVQRLRSKGYKATYSRVASKSGPVYKVQVGHSPSKRDVLKIKERLASSMQLNGFIVNTGVS